MKRRDRLHKQPRKKFEIIGKINIFKILSIFLIVLFIFSIPTVIQKLIQINKIECSSQYGECPNQIQNQIKSFKTTDYQEAKSKIKKILESTNIVSSFLIQYKMPSTLKVDINLKKPKYAIHDQNNKYLLIDENGNILDLADETNLPQILKQDSSYKLGEEVSSSDKNALKIYEKVSWILSVNSGIIEKDNLKINLSNGLIVYFPLDKDVDVLVGSLRLIFSRLNESAQGIKMENVREIDLRFANPVLR